MELDVPKNVEQAQENTYDKKSRKRITLEALISKREKKVKQETIHKITHTGNYGTRPKKRPKEWNCKYCDAPNWNLSH